MSPERKAIIEAIMAGCQTPNDIGKKLGKETQTISKLLYVMTKKGLIQRMQGGKYVLDKSMSSVDNQLDLSISTVDKSTQPSIDISTIESIVEKALAARLGTSNLPHTHNPTKYDDLQAKLEHAQAELDKQDSENANLLTQVSQLGMENSELVIENQDLSEELQDINFWESNQPNIKLALAKLVYIATTGVIQGMIGNTDLGGLIGMTSNEISALKRKGQKGMSKKL